MKLWLARDFDKNLTLHFDRPTWIEKHECWYSDRIIELDYTIFSEVTFENSPQQVELKLIKEE